MVSSRLAVELRCCALALAAVCLVRPAPASAHLGHDVLRAERYLKMDVEAERVRIVVTMTLGEVPMLGALRVADADEDGQVSQAEADVYLAEWTASLQDALPVFVDGERRVVEWANAYLSPIGAVARAEGAVEAVAVVPLESGESVVSVEDRMTVPNFERTDARFSVQPGGVLLTSGVTAEAGEAPVHEGAQDLALNPDDEAAFFAVQVRSPPAPLPVSAIAFSAVAVLLAAAAWFVWRQRRDQGPKPT